MKKTLYLLIVLFFSTNCILTSLFDQKPKTGGTGSSALLLALGGASTSSTDSGAQNTEPAGGGEVTSSGTTLRSTDGMLTIDIPAGAVTESVEFTISKYTPSTGTFPGSFISTSSAYEITPSYRFKKPINISLSLDTTTIQGLNLTQSKTLGFSFSSTSAVDDAGRFPSWLAHDTKVVGDKVVFSTETFSIFGTATPPPGNQPPVNSGAYYYFKPGCSYLPYKIRTQVVDPDGDAVQVYMITGPGNGGSVAIRMTRQGMSNWYEADIPYEAMSATGIQMQISATDSNGLTSFVPSNTIFKYPASSNDPIFIANYNRDKDGDGLLCAWERDNGKSDTNAGDAGGITDSDGDGIPNTADFTPNGEANPVIDNLQIFPSLATMDLAEKIIFGAVATLGGSPRYVNASFVTTGLGLNGGAVGTMTLSSFQPQVPGTAGVVATVGAMNATATVVVKDSLGPNDITTLTAMTISQNKIRLDWLAPGDDGAFGKAVSYQMYRSTSVISNNATCNGVLVNHGLTPKNAGVPERFDVAGLSPNTTYYFCVRAIDDSGNFNNWTGTVSATTNAVPDLTPPADIGVVTATSLGIDKVKLDWIAVGDDGNVGSAVAFEIYKSTSPITDDTQCRSAVEVVNNITPGVAGTPTTLTVIGLGDNTVYYFCVVAVDDSSNYSQWNGLTTATTMRANQQPVVSFATSNMTVNSHAPITLDASASSDPDAIACAANTGSYAYAWTLLNKPPTSTRTSANITSATTRIANFAPDVAGDYILQFVFTDDKGVCGGNNAIDAKSISIHVNYIGYNNVSYETGTPAGYVYSVPVEGVDFTRTERGGDSTCTLENGAFSTCSPLYETFTNLNYPSVELAHMYCEQDPSLLGSGSVPACWPPVLNSIWYPIWFGSYGPYPAGKAFKRIWNPTVTWIVSGNVGFKTNAEWTSLQADVTAGSKRSLTGTIF